MARLRRSIWAAEDGLYRTPRSARGMSPMMMSALKMTAERIADSGDASLMMLSVPRPTNTPANIAGMIAKYLAMSLAIENVVSEPRVMSSCLPIWTISISLVGLESRSTMLPASLAADVPVFIATPTSAWARAGASLVPSPVMTPSSATWGDTVRRGRMELQGRHPAGGLHDDAVPAAGTCLLYTSDAADD